MKVLLFSLAVLSFAAQGAVQTLSAQGGDVEFMAIGKPSFIKIHGTGSSAKGQLSVDGDKVEGKFDFALGSLATGIETRDDHMKNKYLEVQKYPMASLALKGATPLTGWTLATPKLSEASFDGLLTLHGVTRPVTGKFSVSESGKVDVVFRVKLSEFAVSIPTFAGITVADDVEITVKIDKLM